MLNSFQAGWLAILGQQCFNFPFFKKTTKPLISLCMGVCVCMPTSSHWWGPKDRQLAGNLCRLPTIWSQFRIELRSTLALAASASSHWAPSLGFFFSSFKWCIFWTTFFLTSFHWKWAFHMKSKLSRKHRSIRDERFRRKTTSKCHWDESQDRRGSKRPLEKWESKELRS